MYCSIRERLGLRHNRYESEVSGGRKSELESTASIGDALCVNIR